MSELGQSRRFHDVAICPVSGPRLQPRLELLEQLAAALDGAHRIRVAALCMLASFACLP